MRAYITARYRRRHAQSPAIRLSREVDDDDDDGDRNSTALADRIPGAKLRTGFFCILSTNRFTVVGVFKNRFDRFRRALINQLLLLLLTSNGLLTFARRTENECDDVTCPPR